MIVNRVIKLSILLILLVGGATVALAQHLVFTQFSIRGAGDAIILQWTTQQESGVIRFDVERRDSESPIYRRIGQIDAKGTGSQYTYIDNSAFTKPTEQRQYTYRVRGVGLSQSVYSQPFSISHDVSSVRKSWGIIKELFR